MGKIIYAASLLGNPLRITLVDSDIEQIKKIQEIKKKERDTNETWLPTSSCIDLKKNKVVPGYTIISKDYAKIVIVDDEGRECVLDYGDNLLDLEEIHLTSCFRFLLPSLVLSLSPHDVDLISSWLAKRDKNNIKDVN